MNELVVNPITGFLDADNVNAFGSERKQQFLEACREFRKTNRSWPDFGLVCEEMGISHTTFERHLQNDEKFRQEFRALTLGAKYQLESNLFDLGKKKGFEALIWLRKFFPEEYNPDHKVTVEHNINVLQNLIDKSKSIDTQIV